MSNYRNKNRDHMTLTPKLDSKYTNKFKNRQCQNNYTNTNNSFNINTTDDANKP